MNQYDLAGILTTYGIKCSKAENNKQLKKIIYDLKDELDMRKIQFVKPDGELERKHNG